MGASVVDGVEMPVDSDNPDRISRVSVFDVRMLGRALWLRGSHDQSIIELDGAAWAVR